MSMDVGMDNAVPTAEFEPNALAPTQDSQYQWPDFGRFVQSSGNEGKPIDLPEVKRLEDLWHDWRHADNVEEQRSAWREMLQLNADQVFAIGVVNGTRQPVVVSDRIKNVPRDGALVLPAELLFRPLHARHLLLRRQRQGLRP